MILIYCLCFFFFVKLNKTYKKYLVNPVSCYMNIRHYIALIFLIATYYCSSLLVAACCPPTLTTTISLPGAFNSAAFSPSGCLAIGGTANTVDVFQPTST